MINTYETLESQLEELLRENCVTESDHFVPRETHPAEVALNRIMRKAASGNPDSEMMAVQNIENLLDAAFLGMRLNGDNFYNRLAHANHRFGFPNFERLKEMHLDVRNRIAHDLFYQPKTATVFEFLTEFTIAVKMIYDL